MRAAPLAACAALGCGPGAGDSRAGPSAAVPEAPFRDATEALGLADVRHFAGFTPYRFLPETMGGGVGLLDADRDGWLDAYFVDSAPVPEHPLPARAPVPRNRLFAGSADGFRDRTEEAGVGDPGFGMGCAAADVDGEGSPDLYVLNVGPNVLYRNRGDGRFDDVSAAAGVDDGGWGVSAGFFDADRDGDLDLYVVNYLHFTRELHRELFAARDGRAASYPHPDLFDAQPDRFFDNDGTGAFRDATEERGLAVLPGKGLGVAFADVEDDGDPDVYVANDSTPNFLFVNDGRGHFEEIAALAGCAYNESGETEASMGIDFGDADGDGLPDLFTTHLDLETNTYYANLSGGGAVEFIDATRRSRLGAPSLKLTGFGTAFFDYDSDGHLDVFVGNGHILDNVAVMFTERSYPQPDHLFRGRGDGTFENVSAAAGPHFERLLVSRGVAFGDLDRDGDTDLLIGHSGGAPVALLNDATGANRWVRFELRGGRGEPPDGLGARLSVTADGRTRSEELWTSFSYASAHEPAVHFGLAGARRIERVEVRWPSGARESWADLAPNHRYRLTRGDPSPETLDAPP